VWVRERERIPIFQWNSQFFFSAWSGLLIFQCVVSTLPTVSTPFFILPYSCKFTFICEIILKLSFLLDCKHHEDQNQNSFVFILVFVAHLMAGFLVCLLVLFLFTQTVQMRITINMCIKT
jgi:hypothetical protein